MRRLRFKQFLRERNQFSRNGDETLLSVSEYYGVKPRSEAFESEEHESRAATLEGYRIVQADDLVMNYMLAWKGAYGVSSHNGIVSPAYSVFAIDQSVADVRYLHHRVRSDDMKAYFRSRSKGIIDSRLRLYPDSLLASYVELPDLPTQRAIADFLDRETARIDLLIEKKQRLVALLGEKTRSVINRATTVGFRDCETRISDEKWLGEVASHWRITPIKWFARLQSGYAFKADRFGDFGTPLVRMNNLKRGVLDLSDAVSIADDDVNESVLLRAGDILIGMSGSIGETGSLGNFAIVTERDLPCLLNQRVGRFQLVGKDLLPEYLTLVIQSAAFLDPIFLAATSTAQFNVSPSQIGSVLFALPPIVEQQEIVDEISKRLVGLNHVKERSLISIDRLREYRSALITAAVTGQINAAEWGKAGTNERQLDAIQAEMEH